MITLLDDKFSYSTSLAKVIGLNNAIFIQDIANWIRYNEENGKAYADGKFWSYSSYDKICQRHPYWTKRQVQKIIKDCKENGWILVGNFDSNPYNHTNWYTLSDKIIKICIDIKCEFDKPCWLHRDDVNDASSCNDLGASKKTIKEDSVKENYLDKDELVKQSNTGFSDKIQSAFEDWIEYKNEQRKPYKRVGLKNLITTIHTYISRYNESIVEETIRQSISGGWQGIAWNRCQQIQQEIQEKKKNESKIPF